jgi:alkylation response protein AidB-like acyl-CoA dehydrogenase
MSTKPVSEKAATDDMSFLRIIVPEPDLLDEPTTEQFLTHEDVLFRERLRSVLATDVSPKAATADRTSEFAGESYRALADAGLAGILFPTQYGGLDGTVLRYAMAVEEIASACGSTSLIYMTQTHAALPLLVAGTEAQRDHYLPKLCDGSIYGSIAISEPDAGSDVAAMRTTARRVAGGYRISGSKTFITTGDRAHMIICFATMDASARQGGITAFILHGDSPGLHHGRVLEKLGMHGSSTAELFLDDVPLPEDSVLGREGEGWSVLMQTVLKSRISAAAQGVGLARAAYARALGWTKGKSNDDRHTIEVDDCRLANLRTRLLTARLMLYSVARAIDASHDVDMTAQIAMMKMFCTDAGMQITTEALQILGPCSDLVDYAVERNARDVKVTQIYDGTNQIQQLLIVRDTDRLLSGQS